MAGLGALAELELDQLDLRVACVGGKFIGIEAAIHIAAAKVARGHFPDQVTPVDTVVGGDGALARVVRKPAALGAGVERQDGVGTERAKAHGRDIEDAGAVGLGRVRANGDAEVVRGQPGRRHRMVHPFIPFGMHIELGAEGAFVGLALGALVDQGTLGTREGRGLVVTLDEVLPDLRAHKFQHEAQMADDGVVPQNGALALAQVVDANPYQQGTQQKGAHAHPQRRQTE